jgi:putative (di)nucleoside polyphosphate hydrolase
LVADDSCQGSSLALEGRWQVSDKSQSAITVIVEQLLSDPLIQLVMQADRIDHGEAHALLSATCRSLMDRSHAEGGEGIVTFSEKASDGFRPGVGILLFNDIGQVFVAQRIDMAAEAWQMPQGGIDAGELPLEAALRELREEIGVDCVEVLAETEGWLRYEFPAEVADARWDGRWRGQQQKWFAMRLTGDDQDINLATDHPEFSDWRWASLDALPSLVVPFKAPVYEEVARAFRNLKPEV